MLNSNEQKEIIFDKKNQKRLVSKILNEKEEEEMMIDEPDIRTHFHKMLQKRKFYKN